MDLKSMKLAAQEAFVNKRINSKFYTHFAPEKLLKLMAVLEAARNVMEGWQEEEGDLSPNESVLVEAFAYLDAERDGDQESRVIV